jgi:hypothetical protein
MNIRYRLLFKLLTKAQHSLYDALQLSITSLERH